jgi:phosphoribosyl 1,2-cyclic phosphodiesterase
MSLRVCVLGSGSSGNCTYVASERTGVLIDAGLSCKETDRRLASIGCAIAGINAVCVTHEHDDHISSLGVLHRRKGLAVYANAGTIEAIERGDKLKELPWNIFTTGYTFEIGDLRIDPFSVPHDSYDPVGFIISSETARVGIVTDMGMVTGLIRERMKNCHVAIIEANHDEQMLKDAARPWSLKQRISGRQGHLSNNQAEQLASDIAWEGLRVVFLAHLSSDCNKPELAVQSVQGALRKAEYGGAVIVKLTYADKPSDVVDC